MRRVAHVHGEVASITYLYIISRCRVSVGHTNVLISNENGNMYKNYRMYSCLLTHDILLRALSYAWNYQQSAVKHVSSPRKSTRSYPGAPRAEGVDE
jgi:hypothetical protein